MFDEKKRYIENPAPERKGHGYTGPKVLAKDNGLHVSNVTIDEDFVKEADATSVAISELAATTECKHLELQSCAACPEPAGTCPLSPIVEVVNTEPVLPVKESIANLTIFNCVQVNLRTSPKDGLQIIGQLSCGTEVLEMDSDDSNDLYIKVCTSSGVEGFVQRAYVKE